MTTTSSTTTSLTITDALPPKAPPSPDPSHSPSAINHPTPSKLSSSSHSQSSSPLNQLQTLKTIVTDLQTKRLTAIRLYHEQKVLRQQEATRVSELTIHVKSLSQLIEQQKLQLEVIEKQKLQLIASNDHLKKKISSLTGVVNSPTKKHVNTTTTNTPSSTFSNNNKNNSSNNPRSVYVTASQQYKPINQQHQHKDKENNIPNVVSNVVANTDKFSAHVRQMGLLQSIAPHSLTWYSTAMQDVFQPPSNFIALLDSFTETSEKQNNIDSEIIDNNDNDNANSNDHTLSTITTPLSLQTAIEPETNTTAHMDTAISSSSILTDTSNSHTTINSHDSTTQHRSTNDNSVNVSLSVMSTLETEIQQLQTKLKHTEAQCAESKDELIKTKQLLKQLTDQAEVSTQTCKELIQTIKDQEEMISTLS